MPTSEQVSPQEVAALVADRVRALGGPKKAGEAWHVSVQMIHSVTKGTRRPTEAMLNDLGLRAEVIPQQTCYFWKRS